jgi:hypothetical protein
VEVRAGKRVGLLSGVFGLEVEVLWRIPHTFLFFGASSCSFNLLVSYNITNIYENIHYERRDNLYDKIGNTDRFFGQNLLSLPTALSAIFPAGTLEWPSFLESAHNSY